ncbi:MAG TPA: FAD-binding oxidoreductase, partial [Methylomirabilota bacterium]|nr:FAD-binding oxidoreductase [Methylomirabilota bacterium]
MPDGLTEKLRAAVGPVNVLTGIELSPYVVDGRTPEAAVFPGTIEEVAAVMAMASEVGRAVTVWGGGTATSVGMPPTGAGLVMGLRRMSRLLEHEPGDLTATVEAGITVDAFQSALRTRGQWLSLDPPDAGRATVGGVIATNACGPRRHLYGTARDLLIGVTVVTADGSVVKGGGKVVKNVAGYDLPKLFIGSYGTLGVIVEATVKLRPLAEQEELVSVRFERLKDAGAAVKALAASDLIPNAVELLDGAAAVGAGLAASGPASSGGVLVVGFDGVREQVEWQRAELARLAGPLGGRDLRQLDAAAW